MPIFGPKGVAKAAPNFDITVMNAGDHVEVGPFSLQFFGGTHAIIHSSIPVVDNLGVLVNNQLFYPGDSFTIPENVDVDTLAVPSSAPWLKAAEFIDYVLAVQPKRSFATHELINSAAGNALAENRIAWATTQNGGEFISLKPGDTIEI